MKYCLPIRFSKTRFDLLLMSIFLFFTTFTFGQVCDTTNRYTEVEFFNQNQIDSVLDVTYATGVVNYLGITQDLAMDLYYPDLSVDTMSKRPFIMFVHGGGFLNGDKQGVRAHCREFAKRGFVCATLQYRLGWNISSQTNQNYAIYRAAQDAQAGLRYIVEKSDTFRIDTAWMFMGGQSAGSLTSLYTAYVDEQEWNTTLVGVVDSLGGLYTSGNSLTHDFSLKGIYNNWGSVVATALSPSEMLPTIAFHGFLDNVVPFNNGILGSIGSGSIHDIAINNGVCSELNVDSTAGHGFFQSAGGIIHRASRTSCFFKNVMCGTCSSDYITDSIPASCANPNIPIAECGEFVAGSFEFDLFGWTAGDNDNGTYLGPIEVTDSISYQGNYALCVDNQVIHSWKHRVDSDCRFDLTGAETYQISFYALHESGTGEIRLVVQDSSNTPLTNSTFTIDSTGWKKYSFEYTPTTDQPECRLRISFRNLGKHAIDNIVFATQDCNGDFGGTAFIDSCAQCVSGNTGNIACTQDCEMVWGGAGYLDSCGTCITINNGNMPCTQDCNMEWGGTAYLDSCNVCVAGSTMLEPCTQDCNLDWGGTAFVDSCGKCVEGNTGVTGIFDIDSCNVGIGNSFNPDLLIYPNPSNYDFNLINSSSTELDLEVYNSLGEQVYKGKMRTNLTLGKDWNRGVYYLVVQSKGRKFSRTIIKLE